MISPISGSNLSALAFYQTSALQAADASAARLASGRRYTSAAEDAVSMITEISMRGQKASTAIYLKSAQSASDTATSAANGMTAVSNVLSQMKAAVLGLDSANTTSVTSTQKTIAALNDELTRLAGTTTNSTGQKLLDGSIATTGLSFRVAGSGGASDSVTVTAVNANATSLGSVGLKLSAIDFGAGTPTTQANALAAIQAAQDAVSTSMAGAAAVASAMGFRTSALADQSSSIDTAIGNLVDVDTAAESANLSRQQIIAQSAAAMLAQTQALHASMVRQLLGV